MSTDQLQFVRFTSDNPPGGEYPQQRIAEFLFKHLDEYGDPVEDISKCMDFALARDGGLGGEILLGTINGEIAGATILNKTGMSRYIPENILVYIAVDKQYRGQGIGRQIMRKLIQSAEGDVALHVEPDNPARFLYEKMGFESKYMEMRLKRS